MPRPGRDASSVSPEPRKAFWGSLERIVSGGQTGVDRAALDVAIELGIDHGGWCPRGRLSEDGPIDKQYHLLETEESEYSVRTERNVIDSCGTLLIYRGRLQRGSLLTYRMAQKHARPVMRVRIDQSVDLPAIHRWLLENNIRVLNVAGPRASSAPGIGSEAESLLKRVLLTPPPVELFS